MQTRFKAKSDSQDVPLTFRVAKALIERTVPIIDCSSIAALLSLIEKDLEPESQDNDTSSPASSKGRRGRAKGAAKSSTQSLTPEVQKKTKRAMQLIEVWISRKPHFSHVDTVFTVQYTHVPRIIRGKSRKFFHNSVLPLLVALLVLI